MINHLNTPALADAVVADIIGRGGEAMAIAADVSDRDAYEVTPGGGSPPRSSV